MTILVDEKSWIAGAIPSRKRKGKGRSGSRDKRPTQRHIVKERGCTPSVAGAKRETGVEEACSGEPERLREEPERLGARRRRSFSPKLLRATWSRPVFGRIFSFPFFFIFPYLRWPQVAFFLDLRHSTVASRKKSDLQRPQVAKKKSKFQGSLVVTLWCASAPFAAARPEKEDKGDGWRSEEWEECHHRSGQA